MTLLAPTFRFSHPIKVEEAARTAVALPIEVVFWIAVTPQFQPEILPGWAMCKWHMVVGDIVEEVYLVFWES